MMISNPMVKPRIATTPLVATTVLVTVFAVIAGALASTPTTFNVFKWTLLAIAIFMLLVVSIRWTYVIRRRTMWTKAADQKWAELTALEQRPGATTEITVLAFQDVQPTGAWATIRWEKFGYVQPAWIENGTFEIWPGAVLLIRPDPVQIHVGAPWPATYRLRAVDCLASAPRI